MDLNEDESKHLQTHFTITDFNESKASHESGCYQTDNLKPFVAKRTKSLVLKIEINKDAMVKWQCKLMLFDTVLLRMHAQLEVFSAGPDMVMVKATGCNNGVVLNSKELGASFRGKVEAPVQREITQVGKNNSVEIRTTVKNKHQINPMPNVQ